MTFSFCTVIGLFLVLIGEGAVGYPGHVCVPEQRDYIDKVHSELERYEVEVDDLHCRPELVAGKQQVEVLLHRKVKG